MDALALTGQPAVYCGAAVPAWSALLLLFTTVGCVDINGGAIEVGWDLRFPDGRRVDDSGNAIDCEKAGLLAIRLALSLIPAGGEDPCATRPSCAYPCAPQGTGNTGFEIPEGTYDMSLAVVGLSGEALGPKDGIVTPSPLSRTVRFGNLTNLNVHLIIVDRH